MNKNRIAGADERGERTNDREAPTNGAELRELVRTYFVLDLPELDTFELPS